MRFYIDSVKNKKWLILLIVAFPSFFWLILETSTINSSLLPVYGRKQVLLNGDTSYQKVNDNFFSFTHNSDSSYQTFKIDTTEFPLYAIMFIKSKYKEESYRLTGLWEYLNYKKEKINHIPFFLVMETETIRSSEFDELLKLTAHPNIQFLNWREGNFDSINKSYFIDKPYYVDQSFFVLIDKKRHIRGYYDGRYVSELKRLIGEYQHLRLKEEKHQLTKSNEIESNH